MDRLHLISWRHQEERLECTEEETVLCPECLWTRATASLFPVSSLLACPLEFRLASLHNCVSQFLKLKFLPLCLSLSLSPSPLLFPSLYLSHQSWLILWEELSTYSLHPVPQLPYNLVIQLTPLNVTVRFGCVPKATPRHIYSHWFTHLLPWKTLAFQVKPPQFFLSPVAGMVMTRWGLVVRLRVDQITEEPAHLC